MAVCDACTCEAVLDGSVMAAEDPNPKIPRAHDTKDGVSDGEEGTGTRQAL